ncbi:MAG TPA: response regulator [Spirochaetota bacterium]|nr:response regulator [Spirochaetota bacterium]HQO21849.1 response regulator [Spirochaetota bacterium]HQQ23173.1 response regulator [Spirochaetota bacterium]
MILGDSISNGRNDFGKILVVDDDINVNKTLSAFLKKLGYDILNAFNGAEAVSVLEKNADVDLVITDLKMPIMNGRELLSMMLERFNSVPRIVLTAVGSDEDIIHALKTGAYDFLTKPVTDFNLLNHSVKRAIDRKKIGDEKDKANLQLEKMFEIISLLNQGLDIEEIFDKIDISLKSVIPFNSITLVSLDHDEKSFHVKLSHSDKVSPAKSGFRLKLEDTVFHNILRAKDVIIANDIDTFISKLNLPEETREIISKETSSAVIMPLFIENSIKGFLLFLSEEPEPYNEEHLRFLKLIAGQISLSIQRGDLTSQLEMHTKHLEHIVKVRTHELLKTQKTTIFALSKLAETRDSETGEHLERMRNYCVLLAQIMKYSGEYETITSEFMRNIYDSCILHDIGKVGIPDVILLKPTALNHEEFEIIKTHTVIGYNALNDASKTLGDNSFLDMAKDIALYHHERWDGLGYPEGRHGENIPIVARIVTIGDVYDALTSKRPYKEAIPHEETVEIMRQEAFRFDPRIFKLFLYNHEDFDRIRRQFD